MVLNFVVDNKFTCFCQSNSTFYSLSNRLKSYITYTEDNIYTHFKIQSNFLQTHFLRKLVVNTSIHFFFATSSGSVLVGKFTTSDIVVVVFVVVAVMFFSILLRDQRSVTKLTLRECFPSV